MTLVKRSSFSAVANTGTTLDGVFTSTYKNYLVILDGFQGSGGTTSKLRLNFRVGSTTQSAASYTSTGVNFSAASPTVLQTKWFTPLATAYGEVAHITPGSADYPAYAALNFAGVGNASTRPNCFGNFIDGDGVNGGIQWLWYSEVIVADGFILTASTGTISGTVSIYGLAI